MNLTHAQKDPDLRIGNAFSDLVPLEFYVSQRNPLLSPTIILRTDIIGTYPLDRNPLFIVGKELYVDGSGGEEYESWY